MEDRWVLGPTRCYRLCPLKNDRSGSGSRQTDRSNDRSGLDLKQTDRSNERTGHSRKTKTAHTKYRVGLSQENWPMPTINSEKRHLTILSSQVTSLQHKLFRQEFKSTIIIILKASSDQKKDTNWLVYQLVGLARG